MTTRARCSSDEVIRLLTTLQIGYQTIYNPKLRQHCAQRWKRRGQRRIPQDIYTLLRLEVTLLERVQADCLYACAEPDSDAIKFKVGRATNHVRRLDQWGKQCGSKEQIRLGIYPPPDTGESSNLRGLQEIDLTKTAAWCHRLGLHAQSKIFIFAH